MHDSLIKNFGFEAKNIVVLTDEQATHQNIVDHFRSDLTAKAKAHPDSIVLFFYSGHGSRLLDQPQGDEEDGIDETICPVDTDGPDDTRRDIRDDDLNILYHELTPFTRRATFIFDSCHSGTVTRGVAGANDARMKEKPAPANVEAQLMSAAKAPAKQLGTPSGNAPLVRAEELPREGDWASIAGCAPTETSIDDRFIDAAGEKVAHGALTFYLLQAMDRATRRTTNAQIWQETARGVTSKYTTQHPVLEGQSRAAFLGGALKTDAPPVPYRVEKGQIIIGAGANQGALQGGFVGLRAAAGAKDAAEVKVRIEKAEPTRAYATLPATMSAIAPQGTADLLTPYFGTEPVRARLDLPAYSPVAQALRTELTSQDRAFDLVSLSADGEDADLSVHFGPRNAVDGSAKGDATPGYYVLQGQEVLYEQFFAPDPTTPAADVVTRLRDTLENFAQQRNLQNLDNPDSPLRGKVQTQVLRVMPANAKSLKDAPPVVTPLRAVNGIYALDQDQTFRIALKNTTNQPLYAAVAVIGTDGAITLLPDAANPYSKSITLQAAGENGDEGATIDAKTLAPGGTDTYKVLLTSQPTDFSWLERDAVSAKSFDARAAQSPLGDILAQTTRLRADGIPKSAPLEGWASEDFQFQISTPAPKG